MQSINKFVIRKKAKRFRDSFSKKNIKKKSLKIQKKCWKYVNNNFEKNAVVSIYYSKKGEVATLWLIKKLLKKYIVCIPFIDEKLVMKFKKINNLSFLKNERNGFVNPMNGKIMNKKIINLFIVPCLCTNYNKYRVGYGGGHYDKYLKNTITKKICLCFNDLIYDINFEEKHDIKMDIIISESLWIEN